jgi:hypothetical protein
MIFDMVCSLKKRSIIHLTTVLTLVLLCQGCGKIGDPIPPDVAMFEKFANLTVIQEKMVALQHQTIAGNGVDSKASSKAETENFKKRI